MPEGTATVEIDERGRLYVPKAVRQKLDIQGKEIIEITVRKDDTDD